MALMANSPNGEIEMPTNQIWYFSNDGKIVTPFSPSVFGANIVSNVYEDGKGIITFDKEVKSLGSAAFYQCSNLAAITIPKSVTAIGYSSFGYCSSLLCVDIPDTVVSIGDYSFIDCTSISSVEIPESVKNIKEFAFYGCTKLKSVYCRRGTPPIGGDMIFSNNAPGRIIYVPKDSVEAYKAANYWSEYANSITGYDFSDEKRVNTINITLNTEASGLVIIESSDGSGNQAYFDYPVASDIYFVYESGAILAYCNTGDSVPSSTKYWNKTNGLIVGCLPKEDSVYIYDVIVNEV